MTAFPSLIPGSRAFTPGEYPHSSFTSWSGRQNRVRNSNVMLSSQLRLTFVAITEAEMLSILAHYQGKKGGFTSFVLPAEVFSGSTASDYTLSGYGWIYSEPPNVEDLMCGGHNVELTMQSVPPEGTALSGIGITVSVLFAPGSASSGSGAQFSVVVSFAAGTAGAPGLAESVAVTLAAGSATSGAIAIGAELLVYALFTNAAFEGQAFGASQTVTVSLTAGTSLSNPIINLSPVLWYDFSDALTVTLSGTTITQINDKGSKAWNLTKSTTGPVQATWTNNALKCCDWGATQHSNYLRNTTGTSTSIAEVYIVLDAAFGSTFPTYNGLISSTNDSFFVDGNQSTSGLFSSSTQTFNAAYVNGSSSNSYSSGVLPTANSPALLRLARLDGSTITTNGGFQIGRDRYFSNRGWYGLIAEVVCFSTVLSSTDRTAVQNHLAGKWGLTLS